MTTERQIQENLLSAWTEMSVFIRGNRFLTDLSFNEVMICGMLSRQRPDAPLTATELGERTNLLKSQINHILTGMEQRDLIERTRSTTDKRVVYVQLSEKGRQIYAQEHTGVMEILKAVYDEFGSEKTRELTALLKKATAVVNGYTDSNAASKEK